MQDEIPQTSSDIDTNRGIQNAGARFRNRSQRRLTSEQLRNTRRHSNTRRRSTRNADGTITRRFNNVHPSDLKRIYREVQEIFSENGERIEGSDIKQLSELTAERAPQIPFPYFIFSIAVFKDIIDPLDITGVGIVLTTATSFLVSLIIFIWFMNKMRFSGIKAKIINKMLQSRLWLRFVVILGLEFIPFLKILPGTTILILMVYKSESKIVKLINLALDELIRAGVR